MVVRYLAAGSERADVGLLDHGRVLPLPGVQSTASLWALSAGRAGCPARQGPGGRRSGPLPWRRSRCSRRSTAHGGLGRRRHLPALARRAHGGVRRQPTSTTGSTTRSGRSCSSSRAALARRRRRRADRRPRRLGRGRARAGAGRWCVNRAGEIVGYTVCNDVSSRSIEGENPLYLPQAKVYAGGCALGPGIVPAWEVPDPLDLTIDMTITRAGRTLWSGSTNTSLLHRPFDDLLDHLTRADVFPYGVVLSTGTSLVPPLVAPSRPATRSRSPSRASARSPTRSCAGWTTCWRPRPAPSGRLITSSR